MYLYFYVPSMITLFFYKQPNFEALDKELEKRKMSLQEAKLKAKGLNPDGTPALSTMGGFSPASKPCRVFFIVFLQITCILGDPQQLDFM